MNDSGLRTVRIIITVLVIVVGGGTGLLILYIRSLPPPGVCWSFKENMDIKCYCGGDCSQSNESPEELYYKGIDRLESYAGSNQPSFEARTYLCRALCKEPGYGPAYAGLAEVFTKIAGMKTFGGEDPYLPTLKIAEKWLKMAEEADDSNHAYYYAKYNYYHSFYKTRSISEKGTEWLIKAYNAKPDDPRYLREYAVVMLSEKPQEEIAALKKSIDLSSSNSLRFHAVYELAKVYQSLGEYELWEETMQQAVNYVPENPWAVHDYGLELQKAGRCAEAKELLGKAILLMEKQIGGKLEYGEFDTGKENYDSARMCMVAQELEGEYSPEMSKAKFIIKSGNFEKANEILENIYKNQPDCSLARLQYVFNLFMAQDPDRLLKTRKQLKYMEKNMPKSCDTRYLKVFYLAKSGQNQEAQKLMPGLIKDCDLYNIYDLEGVMTITGQNGAVLGLRKFKEKFSPVISERFKKEPPYEIKYSRK